MVILEEHNPVPFLLTGLQRIELAGDVPCNPWANGLLALQRSDGGQLDIIFGADDEVLFVRNKRVQPAGLFRKRGTLHLWKPALDTGICTVAKAFPFMKRRRNQVQGCHFCCAFPCGFTIAKQRFQAAQMAVVKNQLLNQYQEYGFCFTGAPSSWDVWSYLHSTRKVPFLYALLGYYWIVTTQDVLYIYEQDFNELLWDFSI